MQIVEKVITPKVGPRTLKFSFTVNRHEALIKWAGELNPEGSDYVEIAFNRDHSVCHLYLDENYATALKLMFM